MDIKTTISMDGVEVPAPIYSLAYRIGEGAPEAVEIVMEQVGRSDLYWSWISARRDVDFLTAKKPKPSGDGFFDMLTPAAPALQEANSRRHEAWQPIQELIDEARAYIEATGYDGAPS